MKKLLKRLNRRLHLSLQRKLGRDLENFSPHGVPIFIPKDVDESITYLLSKGRGYEDAEAQMISDFIHPNTAVIELGGSLGVISALIRKVIGPEAKHIIVEANPVLIDVCTANANRGASPGATEVIHAAIDYSGDSNVTLVLGSGPHNSRIANNGGTGVSVPAIKLADLAESIHDAPFALVCDIEGSELPLVRLDSGILSRISVLVLETHPRNYPQGQMDVQDIISIISVSGLHLVRKVNDVMCFTRN